MRDHPRFVIGLIAALGSVVISSGRAQPTPTPPPAAAAPSADDLYALGQQLFDQLAPPEIKAQYEFPSKTQWDDFAARLQRALEGDDLRALAAYAPEGRAALTALRAFPDYSDYADWLAARLDEIEAAEQLAAPPQSRPPVFSHRESSIENRKFPSSLRSLARARGGASFARPRD
jgi:hypothetical protein